jgi:hypothetical protein
MLGMVVDCPGCTTKLLITKNRISPTSIKVNSPDTYDTEPATEKQVAFIGRLGGKPSSTLRKYQASKLIDALLSIAPPTHHQLDYLKRNGVPIHAILPRPKPRRFKRKNKEISRRQRA